jgi:hypothetical protein
MTGPTREWLFIDQMIVRLIPNEAHSVDARIARLFHIVHPRLRATDAQR